ncbi:MAG: hypothetical protein ACRDB1_06120 [Microcoleaceae cyanobacterium]
MAIMIDHNVSVVIPILAAVYVLTVYLLIAVVQRNAKVDRLRP